jgi:hypothetical protein
MHSSSQPPVFEGGIYSVFFKLVTGEVAQVDGYTDWGMMALLKAFREREITVIYYQGKEEGIILSDHVVNLWWKKQSSDY